MMSQICQVGEKKNFDGTYLLELGLVAFVEDILHGFPESFLPLEDSLLGDNIRRDSSIKTSLEEKVSQFCDVVVWVVVNDNDIVVVSQVTLVHDEWSRTIIRKVSGQQSTLTNFVPAGTVFTPNCMTFKENWVLVSELHSLNVDSITRNGDSIPPPSHGSIWGSKCLGKPHLFHLKGTGSNCWFLENGTDSLSGFHGVVKSLVVTFVTSFARKIIILPIVNVEVWFDPLIEDQVTSVVGHLFTSNVNHWGRFDSLVEAHTVINIGRAAEETSVNAEWRCSRLVKKLSLGGTESPDSGGC